MTDIERLALKKNRLATLEGSPKNIKSGGVVRKLKRQVRNESEKINLTTNN